MGVVLEHASTILLTLVAHVQHFTGSLTSYHVDAVAHLFEEKRLVGTSCALVDVESACRTLAGDAFSCHLQTLSVHFGSDSNFPPTSVHPACRRLYID
jgi:hypothetical protein